MIIRNIFSFSWITLPIALCFSRIKKKKKKKKIGKAGETLQNDYLAFCLHKHLDKSEIKSIRMIIIV